LTARDYLDIKRNGSANPVILSASEESRFIATLRCFADAQHDKTG